MTVPFADATGHIIVPVGRYLHVKMGPDLARLANRTLVGLVRSRSL